MKVPKSWNDITLQQFIELQNLPETDNEVTKLVQVLAVLLDTTEDDIRELTAKKLNRLGKYLTFLEELPREKKRVNFYHGPGLKFWKWKYYKREAVENTTVGQVTDILQRNQDENNVGVKILNVLSTIYYTGKNVEYNAERYERTRGELLSLPVDEAITYSAFFLTGLRNFLPNVLRRYLKRLPTKSLEKLTQEIGTSYNVNDLIRYTNGTTLL
ncbi:MAG: hypothetical protein ACYTBJ_22810 [Planctomycetota bacterium]|jgi:hypothetical protein